MDERLSDKLARILVDAESERYNRQMADMLHGTTTANPSNSQTTLDLDRLREMADYFAKAETCILTNPEGYHRLQQLGTGQPLVNELTGLPRLEGMRVYWWRTPEERDELLKSMQERGERPFLWEPSPTP